MDRPIMKLSSSEGYLTPVDRLHVLDVRSLRINLHEDLLKRAFKKFDTDRSGWGQIRPGVEKR